MLQSAGYVLNHRPFRENSLLVDLFTEQYGRIACIARPAKKRGKVSRGALEPFRYLNLQWTGKSSLKTLVQADEIGRHPIPASELMFGLYLNELLIRQTEPDYPLSKLFSAYKYVLHHLSDPLLNRQLVMRFELYLLEILGYAIRSGSFEETGKHKSSTPFYFNLEQGIHTPIADQQAHSPQYKSVPVSPELLFALQDIANMSNTHWKALRHFLDQVYPLFSTRPIQSRKLLDFNPPSN